MTIGPGENLAWGRLADALIARRIDLRYRNRRTFCDERQIDYRLTFDIEKARRTNFAKATMLDIARAYAVTPESMERTLRGGSLEPLPEPAPPAASRAPEPEPPAGDEPAQPVHPAVATAISTLVSSLTPAIEVEVRRAQMRNPNASGAVIFTNRHEAQVWDLPLPEYRRIGIIAFLRATRAQREARDGEPNNSGGRARLAPPHRICMPHVTVPMPHI